MLWPTVKIPKNHKRNSKISILAALSTIFISYLTLIVNSAEAFSLFTSAERRTTFILKEPSSLSSSCRTPFPMNQEKNKKMKLCAKTTNTEETELKTCMNELAKEMKDRAANEIPFTDDEVNTIITSLKSLLPNKTSDEIDFKKISKLIQEVAGKSHKQWDRTGESSQSLQDILTASTSEENNEELPKDFSTIMERVLNEGNWNGGLENAKNRSSGAKPWAVLVTGLNGIRKSTSVYQDWFPEILKDSLVKPSTDSSTDSDNDLALPTGKNSFFRQLDHMIAIIASEEFKKLYLLTHEKAEKEPTEKKGTFSPDVIDSYARLKDAIFTRYRTLAEMLGILLLRLSIDRSMNVMVETSGRDVAMFHYIEKFFPEDRYNKLVLHFTINDLKHAEKSVDRRMTEEINEGIDTILSGEEEDMKSRSNIVYANKGGPYGSEVLKGVQRDSDRVWEEDVIVKGGVGESWYKAEIFIEGHEKNDWKAFAIKRDTDNPSSFNKGKEFTFKRR